MHEGNLDWNKAQAFAGGARWRGDDHGTAASLPGAAWGIEGRGAGKDAGIIRHGEEED